MKYYTSFGKRFTDFLFTTGLYHSFVYYRIRYKLVQRKIVLVNNVFFIVFLIIGINTLAG